MAKEKKEIKSIYPLKPNQLDFNEFFMAVHEKQLGKELTHHLFYQTTCPQSIIEDLIYGESETHYNECQRRAINILRFARRLKQTLVHRRIWSIQQDIIYFLRYLSSIFNVKEQTKRVRYELKEDRPRILRNWHQNRLRTSIHSIGGLRENFRYLSEDFTHQKIHSDQRKSDKNEERN